MIKKQKLTNICNFDPKCACSTSTETTSKPPPPPTITITTTTATACEKPALSLGSLPEQPLACDQASASSTDCEPVIYFDDSSYVSLESGMYTPEEL